MLSVRAQLNTLFRPLFLPCGLSGDAIPQYPRIPGEKSTMSVPRRTFLKSVSIAAVAAGFLSKAPLIAHGQDSSRSASPAGYHRIPYEATTDKVFYFTKSAFDPYLNTDFTVRASLHTATLRLIAVEECKSPGEGECFALTFRADRTLSPLSTIHPFEHDALGEFNLFVSTTTKKTDPDGLYYVAVINHRTGKAPAPRRITLPGKQPGSTTKSKQ
jgi:hypothetical protein